MWNCACFLDVKTKILIVENKKNLILLITENVQNAVWMGQWSLWVLKKCCLLCHLKLVCKRHNLQARKLTATGLRLGSCTYVHPVPSQSASCDYSDSVTDCVPQLSLLPHQPSLASSTPFSTATGNRSCMCCSSPPSSLPNVSVKPHVLKFVNMDIR